MDADVLFKAGLAKLHDSINHAIKSDPCFEKYKPLFFTYKDKFMGLETNKERMNFALEYLAKTEQKEDLQLKLITKGKNDEEALKEREKGNHLFVKGKFYEALEFYTRSLATAKSELFLSLAYANRSAVLFKLGFYEECIIVSAFLF